MNYSRLKQGDIVVGDFPYSDLSRVERRPLLIISENDYNGYSEDIIAIKVTSKVKNRLYTIEINNKDLEIGKLKKESAIKVDSIFFLSKKLINNQIASLKKETLDIVKQDLKLLFSIR